MPSNVPRRDSSHHHPHQSHSRRSSTASVSHAHSHSSRAASPALANSKPLPPVTPGTPQSGAQSSSAGGSGSGGGVPDMSALLNLNLVLTLVPLQTGAQERVAKGSLWCYDMLSGCVVLQVPSTSTSSSGATANGNGAANGTTTAAAGEGKKSFRIIKVSQIKSVSVSPPTPAASTSSDSFATFSAPPGGLDVPRPLLPGVVQQREVETVKKDEVDEHRIGRGVSRVGQELFDALAKTNNVRWHEKSIILNDDVMISPPYTVNEIKTASDAKTEGRLERVRKVLEGERSKLFRLHPDLQKEAAGA